jgi:hypothetical protein
MCPSIIGNACFLVNPAHEMRAWIQEMAGFMRYVPGFCTMTSPSSRQELSCAALFFPDLRFFFLLDYKINDQEH